MGAEFFSTEPQSRQPLGRYRRAVSLRLRQMHRWVSVVFTATVAANFLSMIWGQPPAVITYAPLPPLLILLITGLYMLGRYLTGASLRVSLADGKGIRDN